MTALAQLSLSLSQPALHQGLYLPGVQLLRLSSVDLGFLGSLDAPKLQAIQGNVWHLESGTSGVSRVIVTLQANKDSLKQEAVLLEQCAKGVLRKCNRLMLRGTQKSTEKGTSAALQALGRWWRPDPSLVDGSSPHVQIPAPAEVAKRAGAATTAADGWYLICSQLPSSREALAALPQGLTRLELW
jgi:hypothetical protein